MLVLPHIYEQLSFHLHEPHCNSVEGVYLSYATHRAVIRDNTPKPESKLILEAGAAARELNRRRASRRH